jgi:hypothetical protein
MKEPKALQVDTRVTGRGLHPRKRDLAARYPDRLVERRRTYPQDFRRFVVPERSRGSRLISSNRTNRSQRVHLLHRYVVDPYLIRLRGLRMRRRHHVHVLRGLIKRHVNAGFLPPVRPARPGRIQNPTGRHVRTDQPYRLTRVRLNRHRSRPLRPDRFRVVATPNNHSAIERRRVHRGLKCLERVRFSPGRRIDPRGGTEPDRCPIRWDRIVRATQR